MKQPIDDRVLLARYLKPIKSEHISFNVNASFFNLTRVANNSVTQNLSRNQKTLTVSSWIGKKTGYSTTTDFSEGGIKKCIDNGANVLVSGSYIFSEIESDYSKNIESLR